MKIALAIIIGIALCVWLTNAAPGTQNFMAFHPITQEQYDAILGITEGEPIISEARLIASGIAALKGLAAGFNIGLTTSWLPTLISNFIRTERNATKSVLDLPDGYPLCVIKQQEGINYNAYSGRREQVDMTNNISILKCVVVVRQDQTTTTTIRPPPIIDYAHYEQQQAQTHELYNYPYPPWYNAPLSYHENSFRNEFSYPKYRIYPNMFESVEQHNYYPYYTKPQQDYYSKRKSHKSTAKHRKRHPEPENYYDYTLTPTKKRSKTKRDQYSTNSYQQNYAKISNYPDDAYQPAAYPQINYQSQYPKVSYSPSYSYSSPVYVRNPTNSENTQHFGESEDSEEYLKSRID